MAQVAQVFDAATLQLLQKTVKETYVSEAVAEYVVKILDATRRQQELLRGGSPRATLAVVAMAKAMARLRGRDYVVPRDVQEVVSVTLAHRLQVSPSGDNSAEEVLNQLVRNIPAPKLR